MPPRKQGGGGCACANANANASASANANANASANASMSGGGTRRTALIIFAVLAVCVLIGLGIYALVLLTKQRQTSVQVIVSPPVVQNQERPAESIVQPHKLPSYERTTSSVQQVGILTSSQASEDPIILPLYGQRLNRRERWTYYAASDKPMPLFRVPVTIDNRECDDEATGCREIQNGDTVQLSVYPNRTFVATIYKLEAPKYFADSY